MPVVKNKNWHFCADDQFTLLSPNPFVTQKNSAIPANFPQSFPQPVCVLQLALTPFVN
jgi:hypothetical protein